MAKYYKSEECAELIEAKLQSGNYEEINVIKIRNEKNHILKFPKRIEK